MVNVALLGYGTVGNGVGQILDMKKNEWKSICGTEINIKYILDLREFPDDPLSDKITHDFRVIEQDKDVTVVAEMLGGSHPAYDFTVAALKSGKSVVTSNKEVVERFGNELIKLAEENGVRYLFEASVGGGIPIISSLNNSLRANEITEINAILNGTTNYILTKMRDEGSTFDEALADAKALGYAEANPAADVEGLDACRKICILAAMVFGKLIPTEKVYTRGITKINRHDMKAASENSSSIKLIGRALKLPDGKIHLSVEPYAVNKSNPLSKVDDVFNAIMLKGNFVGDVMLYGRGAGKFPTASAVVSDIIDIAVHGSSVTPDRFLNWVKDDSCYVDNLPADVVKETEAYLGVPVGR